MKQSVRYKIAAVCLLLVFALNMLLGFLPPLSVTGTAAESTAVQEETPQFTEISLQESYAKGTELTIPQVKMTLGEEQYIAMAVLHLPDGSARSVAGKETLGLAGQYTLEYKATAGGKTYSREYSFLVYQPKFELSAGGGSAEYKTADVHGLVNGQAATERMTGEYVTLDEGQTLTIYDYFDITKEKAREPVFEAAIVPSTVGAEDFSTLTVRFVSKSDPSQYLEIIGNHSDYNNCTYFLAGANTQTPSGYESSQGTIHVGNTWGAPYSGSFRGTPNNKMTLAQDTLKIYIDYETKCVYANQAKGFVIDLDDPKYFGALWDGFEDGEVYIEVSASRYQSSKPAQFIILKAGDIDLSEQIVTDNDAPTISVGLGEYTSDDLPVGVTRRAYPIFPASAVDYLSGECDVNVHVWARYHTSQKYEVEIEDGAFVPDAAGEYVIEYRAADASGNEAVTLLTVDVTDKTDPVSVSLTDKPSAGKTGEYIAFAKASASGGSGDLSLKTQVTFNGTAAAFDEGGFRAEKAGQYRVTVTATDYVGQRATASYSVTVTASDAPVFIDEIVLPAYLIAGSEYTFEPVYAYDYTSGNGAQRIKATLVTEDANGTREHPDDRYTPSVSAHGDTVKVYYKASVNGKTMQSDAEHIRVCAVGKGDSLDISKYFVSNSATVTAMNDGMLIKADGDLAETEFANPVLAHNLTYTFDVDPSANSFTKLNVYLRDSVNAEERIKVSYTKSSQSASYISVNDGAQYSIAATFFGNSNYGFSLKFDNKTCVASYETEVRITVDKTLGGAAFDGFSSGKVYVSFEFEGVGAEAAILLSDLCGQRTTSITADLVKPRITLVNELAGRYSLGDEVDLTTAVAADVLDPNIQSSYTVYAPDGSVAKDVNGKELKEIPIDESYRIKLEDYGVYRVSYLATDWNGKSEKLFSYALEVVDSIPPVIILNGEVPAEASVGSAMSLPLARAVDFIDGVRDVYAYVLFPDGVYRAYGNDMTFTMSGKYTVVYYAFDESGNTAKLVYTIQVR